MGSPLSPSLVNAFLAHYEQIWLNDSRMSLSLCIIKDMMTIHLLYFDLLNTLKNLMNI